MATEYIEKNTAITAVGIAIADGESWFDALEDIPPAAVRPVVRGSGKSLMPTMRRLE